MRTSPPDPHRSFRGKRPPRLHHSGHAGRQSEARRIEEHFIQKVMSITGATHAQVVRAIPAKGRLTDRLARIYSFLERDLNAPLTDEQQALIYAAEGERKQALKDLPAQAAAK